MRQGQFTKAQRLHIESYTDAFVAALNDSMEGKKLTDWKQKTANEILNSLHFADLDTSEFSRKQLFEMIVRKFTNYRNQVYLKDIGNVGKPEPPSPTGPLFKFSSLITGRQLFVRTNSEAINLAASQRLTESGQNNPGAVYQTVLRERWDALSIEDQHHWGEMAAAGSGDTEKNQQEFRPKMHQALTDLAQTGLIGHAELLLLYAFRKPASGELDIGVIHGHSVHNQANFGGSRTEFQTKYGDPWGMFADRVIPIPHPLVTENSVIPRNMFGVPVFPGIDLNKIAPADARVLIAEYWAHIWGHAWAPATDYPPIPWDDLANNPSAYYDTVKFSWPLPLVPPQTLNTLHTTIWADHLVRTSSFFADTPCLPLQNIVNYLSNPPSMDTDGGPAKTDALTKNLGKRANETQDSQTPRRKRAKKNNENRSQKGNEGPSSRADPCASRPSSRKISTKSALQVPVNRKNKRGQGRHLGYVYSDEDSDAFEKDA
ncbi:hypothetical protein C8R45DRAFT_1098938 [Mycena sanguinolenta]|nr:hypothetical protein C8R45DRAFT_1098938 [Mycena sanguinolenta]